MRRNKLSQEYLIANGRGYLFDATLGRAEVFCDQVSRMIDNKDDDGFLKEYSPSLFAYDLASGNQPLSKIRLFLSHMLVSIDGNEPANIDVEIDRLMQDIGTEEAANLCLLLNHHIMIGNVKKKIERRSQAARQIAYLLLAISKKPLSWLVVALAIGAILVCMNFSCFLTYIASLTV